MSTNHKTRKVLAKALKDAYDSLDGIDIPYRTDEMDFDKYAELLIEGDKESARNMLKNENLALRKRLILNEKLKLVLESTGQARKFLIGKLKIWG